MNKKTLILVAAVVGLIGTVAAGVAVYYFAFSKLSPEKAAENAYKTMSEKVKTYHIEKTIEAKLDMEATEEVEDDIFGGTISMTMEGKFDGNIDIENKTARGNIETSLDSSLISSEEKGELYVNDKDVYFKNEDSDDFEKMDTSDGMFDPDDYKFKDDEWEKMKYFSDNTNKFEYKGEEKVGDTKCYVYSTTDTDVMKEFFEEDDLLDNGEDAQINGDLKIYINPKTGYITRISATLDISVDPTEEEPYKQTGNLTVEATYSNFNKASVEKPDNLSE